MSEGFNAAIKKKYGGDPQLQMQMGSLLRQVYGSVIAEPVPDRFSALLDKLAHAASAEGDRKQDSAAEQTGDTK